MMRWGKTFGQEESQLVPTNRKGLRQRKLAGLVGLMMGIAATSLGATECTLAATGVVFGTYDFLSQQDLEGVGSINIQCDTDTSYTIALSEGYGSYETRLMMSDTHQLRYNLYTDAARTIVWGDGINGSTQTVGGSRANQAYPVYAKAPAGQNPYVGTYTDAITVTLTF